MINSLFTAKTGMEAMQTQLDVISHNLANVSTTGYKRASAQFQDLIYQNLRQAGGQTTEQTQHPTGLDIGLGTKVIGTTRDFKAGSQQLTSNAFDVAISGSGFFEIQMPDGTIAYTRDGTFKPDANGQLVNASGYPLAAGISIPTSPAPASVTIGADGVVSITTAGNPTPQAQGTLMLSQFVNPAGLQPVGENLYRESAASGPPQQGTPGTNGLGTLQQGYLEASNVNVVQELVTMIQTQRAYEMNSKAIQTSDQMLAKLAQL